MGANTAFMRVPPGRVMLREGMGCLGTATHISGLYQVEAGQDVPRSVGQYAGADIAAPVRQHAEGEPVQHDSQHRAHTLITVSDAKDEGLSQDRKAGVATERVQLPLQ